MKLGTCHLWGDDLEDFKQQIQLADQLGFDVIGIGDSPAGWHDVFTSMTIAAQQTAHATIMPFVTSPFVRHPLAAANALCSIDELSGGRVKLGLSTGGSNTLAIGHKPATQHQIRDYWQAIKGLFDGQGVSYQGSPVSALQFPRTIPIYYSAFGPKALQLAGEQADGVIMFTNGDMDLLDQRLEIMHSAAKKAGRKPEDIDIIVTSFCSIRPTREQALDDLKAFIVVNGMAIRTPELLAQVPAQFRPALDELQRRYDPSEHVVVGGKNAQLLDELGLLDYLSQFDTVAGDADTVCAVLKGLKQRGVSTFIANMPGHADRAGTMQRLSELKSRL
jgi:alkanesulfonate monooxygenase SsuD/methylene tetrahydromethanopterin reductase-like flavin-dependent oxidoreductase (luciferase family)